MVKAVIFDMDGTVADTLRSIAGFGNAALEAHGFPALETELYRQLVGNGADVLIRRMLDTKFNEVIHIVISVFAVSVTPFTVFFIKDTVYFFTYIRILKRHTTTLTNQLVRRTQKSID